MTTIPSVFPSHSHAFTSLFIKVLFTHIPELKRRFHFHLSRLRSLKRYECLSNSYFYIRKSINESLRDSPYSHGYVIENKYHFAHTYLFYRSARLALLCFYLLNYANGYSYDSAVVYYIQPIRVTDL